MAAQRNLRKSHFDVLIRLQLPAELDNLDGRCKGEIKECMRSKKE